MTDGGLAAVGVGALRRVRGACVRIEVPGWFDPQDVFSVLFGAESASFWFEGELIGDSVWMGAASPDSCVAVGNPSTGEVHVTASGRRSRLSGTVSDLLSELRPGDGVKENSLGWVGWVGYDSASLNATLPVRADAREDSVLFVADRVVRFDIAHRRMWIHAVRSDADWVQYALAALQSSAIPVAPRATTEPVSTPGLGPGEYAAAFARVQNAIEHGEVYVTCLTDRLRVIDAGTPAAAFAAIRRSSAGVLRAIIRGGDTTLVSASTETFLAVNGREVVSRPVKGTRARHRDEVLDRAAADQLAVDSKELAENVMIVDLLRNDLSRVCSLGSIDVVELLRVESRAHVHQLVSTIRGNLKEDISLAELLGALLPAGSMTGAPKRAAVGLISEIEASPRGEYAGALGWFGAGGAARLAMTIRTIVFKGSAATIGTGGGVTACSDRGAEQDELVLKAVSLLDAIRPVAVV
ncbi:anthranilate synthase component I family protein [Herbiconiux sp. A18JL235]|uniref:Anthranilate synthase component I family protein n=1 Tax=Herbiconiux sp. A18JL235 TaxID=3152363 RepID=A0AB39BHT7_9MICO